MARVLTPLQVPEGQGAVQQGQHRPIVGQAFDGVGQSLHLPHRAQRGEQRAGDQRLTGCLVGRAQVEIVILHGQGGFAEQPAAVVLAVVDDAPAQVDEVAAQGQVAVHVDVGAVHGHGGPVFGNLWRGYAAQQALGAGAGGDVGTPAHRGGAEGGLVGGDGEGPVGGVVQASAASDGGVNHAVKGGQQLVSGQPQVQCHDAGTSEPVRGVRRCGTSWCRTRCRRRGWRDGRSSW